VSTTSKMTAVLGDYQPESEPTGYCPIGACVTLVPLRVLVCRVCVAAVPDELLDAYYATHRPGQTLLTASPENVAAAAAIIQFGQVQA
jgi:hypothetical protein